MTSKEIEFQNFLKIDEDRAEVNPPRQIVNDLVTSEPKLVGLYVLAASIGYLLSLSVCAQRSIGISPLAWQSAAIVMRIPDPWCPLVCGAIFGVFPFIGSSIFLTRFQHRYLLFRMAWLPILVPLIASVAMAVAGAPHDIIWLSLWFLAAIGTPYFLEGITAWHLRQRKAEAILS